MQQANIEFLGIKKNYQEAIGKLNDEYDEMLSKLEKNILHLLQASGIDTSGAAWGNGTSVLGERNSQVRDWYHEISYNYVDASYEQYINSLDMDEYPTKEQFELMQAWNDVTQALQYGLGE